jgi:hypothetical protein
MTDSKMEQWQLEVLQQLNQHSATSKQTAMALVQLKMVSELELIREALERANQPKGGQRG